MKTSAGRLIVDPPHSGSWNMAVDAAILASMRADDPPTLRFYRWARPTLSIGYFQSVADRARHPHSQPLDLVRRETGGGAIVHDREITYSLTLASSFNATGAAPWIYQTVHECAIKALSSIGISANRYDMDEFLGNESDANPAQHLQQPACDGMNTAAEPFLCFQRRTSADLIVNGYKILGSAQRRGRQGILQHGSLLLAASGFAPELPGICEFGVSELSIEQVESGDPKKGFRLSTSLAAELALSLNCEWELGTLRPAESLQADAIERQRFGNSAWNEKR